MYSQAMRNLGRYWALAVFASLGSSDLPQAGACTCAPYPTLLVEIARSDAVFAGTILDRIDPHAGSRTISTGTIITYPVAVHQIWKGALPDTVEVGSARGGSSCGYPFEIGGTYLIFAHVHNGQLRVSLCSRTQDWSPWDSDTAALGALPVVGLPEAVDSAIVVTLLDGLFAKTAEEKQSAVDQLVRVGKRTDLMAPVLADAYHEGQTEDRVRLMTMFAQRSLDVGPVSGLILAALEERDPDVRASAIAPSYGVDEPVELKIRRFRDQMDDNHPAVREAAVRCAVNLIVSEEIVEKIVELLDDPDTKVRAAAAQALHDAAFRVPEAFPKLLRAMEDPSPTVRQPALRAIAEFGVESPTVISVLLRFVRDPDERIRNIAVKALIDQRVSPEVSLPVFQRAICDSSEFVSSSGLEGLERLLPNETAVAALFEFLQLRAAPAPIELIADRDSTRDLHLTTSPEDREGRLRSRALDAICRSSHSPSLKLNACRIALADPARQLRISAVHALGGLALEGNADALALLQSCADGVDESINFIAKWKVEHMERPK